MSFSPIAYTIPNYRDYPNYWLKAYKPGESTPKSMALNGETQVVKVQLNADGFPVSAGGALVIPYIEGAYDLWAFPTEEDADNNNTTNAKRFADDVTASISPDSLVITPYTLAEAKSLVGASIGQKIRITDRKNSLWKFIEPTVSNELDLIENTGSTLTIQLDENSACFDPEWIGATPLDTFDSGDALIRSLELSDDVLLRDYYYTTKTINVAGNKSFKGVNSRSSGVIWLDSDLTGFSNGVLTSLAGTDGSPEILFSSVISDMQIVAADLAPCAFANRGWQENSVASNLVISGGTESPMKNLPINETTHGASYLDLHIIPSAEIDPSAVIAWDIQTTQKCNIKNITTDISNSGSQSGKYAIGLKVHNNSILNAFENIHTEDADVGIDNQSPLNTFIGLEAIGVIEQCTTHFQNTSDQYTLQSIRTVSGFDNHIDDSGEIIAAGTATSTSFEFKNKSGFNRTLLSSRRPSEFQNGLLLKESSIVYKGNTGNGVSKLACQSTIPASSTKYLEVEFSTAESGGGGLNIEVFSGGDQRYYTQRQLAYYLPNNGAAISGGAAVQSGTNVLACVIGEAEPLSTPTTSKLRVPLTNGSATFAQTIELTVTGTNKNGKIKSIEIV